MKPIILIISVLFFSFNSFAQDSGVKTETLSVKGNCEECKNRIENAADIKGVKIATWNADKQVLTLTYRPDKVSLDQIKKSIAAAGHDVAGVEANLASYNKLPKCCKYRTNKCEDDKK